MVFTPEQKKNKIVYYCMAEGGVFIGRVLKFSSEETGSVSALPEVILHGCFWGE